MELLILAKSYKDGSNYCIAGIDLLTKAYVRIGKGTNCDALSRQDITIQGHEIDLLDVVDVTAKKLPANGCHTEDYELISLNHMNNKYNIGQLNTLYSQINHPNDIFGCFNNCIPSPCSSKSSLLLLKVNNFSSYQIVKYNGELKGKAKFYYRSKLCSDYSLTDSNINGFQYGREFARVKIDSCFILISLPEDNWAQNHRYYKFVAGVIC